MSEEKPKPICYSPYPDCPYTNPYYCELWRSNNHKLRIMPSYSPSDKELDQERRGKEMNPDYKMPEKYNP